MCIDIIVVITVPASLWEAAVICGIYTIWELAYVGFGAALWESVLAYCEQWMQ